MSSTAATLSLILLSIVFPFVSKTANKEQNGSSVYHVSRLKKPIKIDGNWDKPQWKNVKEIPIDNYMGVMPAFCPSAKAKMMYDGENLYLIFCVEDRYVRCIVQDYNGPVSTDACVEFFFSPDTRLPESYFNLEINGGGTPLMGYNTTPRNQSKRLEVDDIKKIEIAHSLPQIVDPEITEPITWTIEYRIPLPCLKNIQM